jgi:hypothetical protein
MITRAIVGVCGIRRMRERRVEKKGDDQMARREWGRTCRNK